MEIKVKGKIWKKLADLVSCQIEFTHLSLLVEAKGICTMNEMNFNFFLSPPGMIAWMISSLTDHAQMVAPR